MTKTVEVDADVVKAISDEVAKSLQPQIDEIKAAQEADVEKSKLKTDETVEGEVVGKYDSMTKEKFAIAQLNAALQGNGAELAELNKHALKTLQDAGLVEKATYLNAGTDADGGVFVPNAELLKDVFSVLPEFSSVAGLLREITLTEGDSIDVTSITADVVLTEVGTEGGTKTVTKPTTAGGNVAVREFAGIAILTKKLLKQSAIDVYGIIRDSFARAIAKKREQLILTDSTSGIALKAGVASVVNSTASAANAKVDSLTVKQVKSLPFKVPTASAAGGTYVFSRLLLAELDGKEDSTGQPVVTISGTQSGGALSGTFNGYPFVVSEVLGVTDAASTVHAIFGNFGKYGVLVRQGAVDAQVFDSGIVVDGSSVSHNLIQENKVAMRQEIWENVGYPIPSAFAKLSTTAAA